jgi:hypothetical protein
MKKSMIITILAVITSAATFLCLVSQAMAQISRAEWKPEWLFKVTNPEFEVDYHARQRKTEAREKTPIVVAGPEIADKLGPATASPPPLISFDSHSLGHDPSVAVGHTYLVVIRSHKYSFYDKQGALLPTKNGVKSQWGSTEFFAPLWADKNPDGTTNQNSINRHLGFPRVYNTACDPANPNATNSACVNEFYDSRALYDFERKRFFIIAAARNQIWRCGGDERAGTDCEKLETLKRRYIAVAVSQTEDPRDGFNFYILVNQYADWPQAAIQGKYLVLNHRSNIISSPDNLKVFVFLIDPLVDGTASSLNTQPLKTFSKADFPNSYRVFPVTHRTVSNNVTLLVAQDTGKSITVFGIQSKPGSQPPTLVKSDPLPLPHDGVIPLPNPVFRAGRLHLTTHVCVVKNGDLCERYSIRLMRIPVTIGADKIPKLSQGGGYINLIFGRNALSDADGDLVSYMYPSLDVTKNGDIVIVYVRAGVKTAKPLYPEVRYSVYYRDATKIHRSALLAAGDFDVGKPQDGGLDHGGAYLDPNGEDIVWVSHARADSAIKAWRQVVGAVKP